MDDIKKYKYLYFKNKARSKYKIISVREYEVILHKSGGLEGMCITLPIHTVRAWFEPPSPAEQVLFDGLG